MGYECYDTVGDNSGFCESKTRCMPHLDVSDSVASPGNNVYTNYYCEDGNALRTACPAGTYTLEDRPETISACLDCLPGYYCPEETAEALGSNARIAECVEGYYCPGATDAGIPCPAGYYCPEGVAMPVPCANGYYCENPGTTPDIMYDDGQCDAGYTCGQSTWCYPNSGLTTGYTTSGCVDCTFCSGCTSCQPCVANSDFTNSAQSGLPTCQSSNSGATFCMNDDPNHCVMGATSGTGD
jgi:hypothetical protein